MDLEDIYGSSYIGNFLDYAFGLRKSNVNPSEIILKLLKTRMDVNNFDSENIIVFKLENIDGVPIFSYIGIDSEVNHLKNSDTNFIKNNEKMISELEIIKNCKELKLPNTTIANILKLNEKTIRNKLKLIDQENSVNPN
ncbi:hypothetical protein OBK25_03000 [Empedobacter falsenii]